MKRYLSSYLSTTVYVAAALALGAASVPSAARAASAPAYRVNADVVSGGACIEQSVFAPGSDVVFRAEVADNNGVPLTAAQIAARGVKAVIELKDGSTVNLRFGTHPPGKAPKTTMFWSGSLLVKADHPTGTLPWTLSVTDKSGGHATFQPIGQVVGLSVLTIAKKSGSASP